MREPGKCSPHMLPFNILGRWGSYILELEMNADTYYHNYFHAIGSAGQTAYAMSVEP